MSNLDKDQTSGQNIPFRTLVIAGGVGIVGGVETNLLQLLQILDPAVVSPLVVMPGEGPLTDQIRALGVPCEIVRYYGWRARNPFRHLGTLARLITLVYRHRIKVLYLNHHCMLEFASRIAAVTRLPLVCHVRGVEDDAYMAVNRQRLRSVDVVIATSRAVYTNLVRWGVEECRIRLIYDAINPSIFAAQTSPDGRLRSEYGIPVNAPLIGVVSRLRVDKGIPDFIRAAALVATERPDVRFLVIGADEDGGQATRHFKSLAESLGLGGHLVFTGFCDDVPGALRALDVFVLASWMEACPLSVMESMAAGTIVVATAVGGVPEVIEDGVSGLLCPAHDPVALAARILAALSLGELDRENLVARARARVFGQFQVTVQARALEDVLTSIVLRR